MNLLLNTLGDPVWQILTVILVLALPVGSWRCERATGTPRLTRSAERHVVCSCCA